MHFQNDNVDAKGKFRAAVPLTVLERAGHAAEIRRVPLVPVSSTLTGPRR
jgi:hypothetical protein